MPHTGGCRAPTARARGCAGLTYAVACDGAQRHPTLNVCAEVEEAADGPPPTPEMSEVIFIFAIIILVWAAAQPATWKAMALSGLIIGFLLCLTGLGVIIGVPMIVSSSMVLCCCMESKRVRAGRG
eukprot:Tamp_30480.p2 GENE.Tamp_30480~~Tamp_30480.p2  ORF type:complete len:126 (-),score=12.34 Tamp_30480:141-518(-)